MKIWLMVAIIIAVIIIAAILFFVLKPKSGDNKKANDKKRAESDKPLDQQAEEEPLHFFNKEFREELRNRGRLRFERIIDENAMFLKQDLQLTTSQLNDYMKKQIQEKIDTQFEAYAKAMQDLQELAKQSLQQATSDVEKQRSQLTEALDKEIGERKAAVMRQYEANLAQVVEHYLLKAIGEQLDFKAQLPYIIDQMEKNKRAIAEDMKL